MALQQPLIVYPALDETVDATSSAVTFYLKIRGTQCIKYIIYIYDVATNTQQYTATVTLGTTLYDGETLNIVVDISALGANSYYWKIDLYYGAGVSDYIISNYYTFNASTPPTIAFSPSVPSTITTPSYTFIGSYVQAEGIEVKYFAIKIYNSTTTQAQITAGTATAMMTSGETWSNNIRYTANGLISLTSYQVQITGMTQKNVAFATALTAFTVAYTVPNSLVHPTATLNDDTSVTLDWGKNVAITGTTSGSVSYEANYLFTGNVGLNLAAGANVQFALDFSAPFTQKWIQTPAAGFTGVLGGVEDTAGVNYLYLGYDGTKFYLNINGNYYYYTPEAISNVPYLFAIIHDGTAISFYHRVL